MPKLRKIFVNESFEKCKNNISVFIFYFHKMYVRVEIDKKIYYVKREKFDVFLFSEHLIPADKIDK